MNVWAWLVANPRVALRIGGYGVLAVALGLMMLRAERAERKAAEAHAGAAADHWQLEVCKDDRDGYIAQLNGYSAELGKARERVTTAERAARRIHTVTVERVRELRVVEVPRECTAAIVYAATEAPRVAAWGTP